MSERDDIPRIVKIAAIIFIVVGTLFAFIELNARNQPLLCGDDMSVWFEHEYSELREEETAIYQQVQLDGSVMVLQLKNLSLTRNYLLVQRKDDKSWGVWIEFNGTESDFFCFNHNNKDFYLCAWIYRDKWQADGWDWIISFTVIKD